MTSSREVVEAKRHRPRDRKQQILGAARDLFVEHGYPSVTMAMIADQVGITAGALYRHFGNKADLLEAVIEENFAWLRDPRVPDDFDEAIEAQIEQIAEHPYLTDLWIHEVRYLSHDTLVALRGRMLAWHMALIPVLRARRTDLDEGQEHLVLWSAQSVLSCLSRRSLHAPESMRRPAVKAALKAVTAAPLLPTGPPVADPDTRVLPASMRERLLLAAFEQFGARGFHDTSMADIASIAGVTGPNLYGYFASKADILRAVHERAAHALWFSLDEVLASAGTADELIENVVRSYVRLARTWSSTLDDPMGSASLGENLKVSQREYVDEWVELLGRSLPDLEAREARLRVQIALFLVSDLYRIPRVSYRQSFQDNAVALVLGILRG